MMECEIEILSTGQIRFCRCSKKQNEVLFDFLKEVGVSDLEGLVEFFEAGNSIEHIIGNEQLCG